MKKTILSILAGATMLSSAAIASPSFKIDATDLVLPTGDQVLSDLYNPVQAGINNTHLSKYEQAWMIKHEKNTLFKHKTFWVRSGKVFTGIHVDKLKDLDRSERIEMIKSEITIAQITSLFNTQLEMLAEAQKKAIADLTAEFTQEHTARVNELNMQITELTEARDLLQSQVDGFDVTIDNADAINAAKDRATFDGDRALVSISFEGPFDSVRKGYKFISVTRPDGSIAETLIDDTAIGAVGKKAISTQNGNDRYEPTTVEGLQITGNTTVVTTSSGITYSEAIENMETGITEYNSVDGYTGTITIDTRPDPSVSIYDSNFDLVDGVKRIEIGQFAGLDVGSLNSFVDTIAELSYDEGYADGFANGYDEGFSDGYESGYADGYHDGFHDGVASVK